MYVHVVNVNFFIHIIYAAAATLQCRTLSWLLTVDSSSYSMSGLSPTRYFWYTAGTHCYIIHSKRRSWWGKQEIACAPPIAARQWLIYTKKFKRWGAKVSRSIMVLIYGIYGLGVTNTTVCTHSALLYFEIRYNRFNRCSNGLLRANLPKLISPSPNTYNIACLLARARAKSKYIGRPYSLARLRATFVFYPISRGPENEIMKSKRKTTMYIYI